MNWDDLNAKPKKKREKGARVQVTNAMDPGDSYRASRGGQRERGRSITRTGCDISRHNELG